MGSTGNTSTWLTSQKKQLSYVVLPTLHWYHWLLTGSLWLPVPAPLWWQDQALHSCVFLKSKQIKSLNARSHVGQSWVKPLPVMVTLNIYLCPTARVGDTDTDNDVLKQFYNSIYQLASSVCLITVPIPGTASNRTATANGQAPWEIKSVCALSS